MTENLLKFCIEKGVLLDKETSNLLSEFDDNTVKEIIDKVSLLREKIITKSFFYKNAEKIHELIHNEKVIDKLRINFGVSFEISREKLKIQEPVKDEEKNLEEKNEIKILSSPIINTRKIVPQDFVKYFKIRYNEMKKFLMDRKELDNLVSLNKINGQKQAISIIGMVFDKKITKNKNIMLEVEDLTGKIKVLISKEKAEVYEKARDIIIDDIIGIKGFGNSEIIFANNIFYPDIFLHEKVKIDRDEKIAFISDIHVGSKNFLEENFFKFISWINGEKGDEEQKIEAKKVKYLLITGDCVDGVGVFPGQEEQLNIKDIFKQYEKLAEYLKMIRKDVKIILCPGQHDAVRIAEPQPFIGKEYGKALYELENLILVSNPSMIEITNGKNRGIKILMYHGASLSSYVSEIESLRVAKAHWNPSKVIKEMLKRRHLCSIHSSVTYIPDDKQDSLLIKEVPDIINTGDFHRPDVDIYNNILIICSSCWQSITPFEEKVGNVPDPCKVPVLNLKTREIKILDFN